MRRAAAAKAEKLIASGRVRPGGTVAESPAQTLMRSMIDGYDLVATLASCGGIPAQEERPMKPEGQKSDNDNDEEEDEEDDVVYVMDVVKNSTEDLVGTIWSDFCIRVYDVSLGLCEAGTITLNGHKERITGITFGDSLTETKTLFSAAEDGLVLTWDVRTGSTSHVFQVPGGQTVSFWSLDVGCDNQLIAGGTEEDGDSRIIFWDRRMGRVLAQYEDSHSDSVSQLCFNTHRKTELVSASLDGLICVFDITKSTEDDALLSVLNADGPVSKIGFFGPQHECIYCLTHNETLSLFHAESAATMAQFPSLREQLGEKGLPADYLIDCCYMEGPSKPGSISQTLVLVSGNHQGEIGLSDVTLAGVRKLCTVSSQYGHSRDVRSVSFLNREGRTGIPSRLLTGGEDGQVCDWRHMSSTYHTNSRSTASMRQRRRR